MFTLEKITLEFPDGDTTIKAVNDITLHVPDGKVVGITGPSGSGKSSLLAVASTLITPQQGKVIINDTNVTGLNNHQKSLIRKDQLGIVFQQANLIPSLTALEQVYSVQAADRSRHVNLKTLKVEAAELLNFVGLDEHRHKRPHQLSGGQKQRVNIARALSGNPTNLVIDEPTSALDQERGYEIIELILKVAKEFNTATLLVTHDQSHLPLMHDVKTMVDGKFVTS